MNTPDDASDTAINRLVDAAEHSLPIAPAPDKLQAEKDATARELREVEMFLDLSGTALSPGQLDFVHQCLVGAYLKGRSDAFGAAALLVQS